MSSEPVPKPRRTLRDIPPKKTPMREQSASDRAKNFQEVNLGYSWEEAQAEASRCLQCAKPPCVPGCPVHVKIPQFIACLAKRDAKGAYKVLLEDNALPAVCGRVCPQETLCEARCIVRQRGEPVGIGHLERFAADEGSRLFEEHPEKKKSGHCVAVIGSGPAGLACAQELARAGVEVIVYEALHILGGVLSYGIPPFRLPRQIVQKEIQMLKHWGVQLETNKVIGRTYTLEQLFKEKKCDAVFIGIGAGSPLFAGVPGENLNGVFSANEFLTRVNLMEGYKRGEVATPLGLGKKAVVVGAGNTAMDAARCALRLGAEVTILYRRTRAECPARAEELRHAQEEGVQLIWLAAPVEMKGGKEGHVSSMRCVRMQLGEPDASGRRRPIPIEGDEFKLEADTVIYALGTRANPLLTQSVKGLALTQRGYIEANPETYGTSLPGVFAGGDIITGSATVISALGAGKHAAQKMLEYLKSL